MLPNLSQNFMDNLAVHIRETEVSSLETISQFRVIETEQMQDRRMKIVHVNAVFGDVEPEFVRFTKH